MKKVVGGISLVIKCCKLYYEESLTQNEISEILGISRPTVSRLLAQGKEEGYVKIEIINPIKNNHNDLERNLEKRYGLREVLIIDDDADTEVMLRQLSKTSAEYLQRIVRQDDKIGISMGNTVKGISKYIDPNVNLNLTFFPLIGGVGQSKIEIHSNQIVMDLARAFRGNFKLLHAPAIVSDPKFKENFTKEISIKDVLDYSNEANIAIVGMGAPTDERSTMMKSGYFDYKDMEKFKEQGAVGDICLNIYDINGEFEKFEYNKRVIGISLDKLKKIKTVIGVTYGEERVEATVGALRGNLIDVLITNYSNAKNIIDNY